MNKKSKQNIDKDAYLMASEKAVAKNNKQQKKKKKDKKKKKSKKRWILRILLALFILGILAVGAIGIYAYSLIAKAPEIEPEKLYSLIAEKSRIYDDEGNTIDSINLSEGNRTNLDYEEIPDNIKNAFIAIEDKTFREHSGFNYIRIVGAIKTSVFGGGKISGTSTITQQLARNVYLSEQKSKYSIDRKIIEAYYTHVIEDKLSKDQILEAYLNTIYLGHGSLGIEEAAQTYFGKSAKDLDLIEATSLAAITPLPSHYALISDANDKTETKNLITTKDGLKFEYTGYRTDDRRKMILKLMKEQKYISEKEYNDALSVNLKERIKPKIATQQDISSYFADYTIDIVRRDLMKEYGIDKAQANTMIYAGGLQIHTSLDRNMQKTIEAYFAKDSNFPNIAYTRKDGNGNIVNKKRKIMLKKYENLFSNNSIVLKPKEFKKNADGSLTLLKGFNLKFIYNKKNDTVAIKVDDTYRKENGRIEIINGGILDIPNQYKKFDGENVIISKSYLQAFPNAFKASGNNYLISEIVTLNSPIVQPQASMVVIDNETGNVKAMLGGRKANSDKFQYNRALNPRQPGSSIKPLAVYSAALQLSFEKKKAGETFHYRKLKTSGPDGFGRYITAGSIIHDAPLFMGKKQWPKNWYSGFRGHVTLRNAVEQSINVCAAKVLLQVGEKYAAEHLKSFGVTTIQKDDLNPAALALGGMTKGISPLEMASAYTTFANKGVHIAPSPYVKVLDRHGKIILTNKPKKTKVLDEGVNFIIRDILRTTVTRGLARPASIRNQITAGKTGTTSNKYDIWFCGFTPKYSASLWIGNDVNMELTSSSTAAVKLWGRIMNDVLKGEKKEKFSDKPDNVQRIHGEYYITGTYGGAKKVKSKEQIEEEKKKAEEEAKKKAEEEKKKAEEEAKKKAEEANTPTPDPTPTPPGPGPTPPGPGPTPPGPGPTPPGP